MEVAFSISRVLRASWAPAGQAEAVVAERRVIGILAHVDAGKTTISERLLHAAGEVRHAGSVDRGNTVTDWLEDEQERGITISTAAAGLVWRDVCIDVVDTPGHIDFSIEVERVLRVLDGAVLVVSAPDGVQAQTEAVWQALRTEGVPTIAFLNKLDAPHRDLGETLERIGTRLDIPVAPLQWPIYEDTEDAFIWYGVWDLLTMTWHGVDEGLPGACEDGSDAIAGPEVVAARERLLEVLAEADDGLMALYLDGAPVPEALVASVLVHACSEHRVLPILFGVAVEGIGIEALLDAICKWLPSPELSRPRTRFTHHDLAIERSSEAAAAPCVYVFKTETRDDAVIAYIRTFGGLLRADQPLVRAFEETPLDPSRLVTLLGRETFPADVLDYGAVGGLVFTRDAQSVPISGDTLGAIVCNATLERHGLLLPVVWSLFEAGRPEDHGSLADLLRVHTRDDPSLVLQIDAATGQFLVGGRGELHLEILHRRVARALGEARTIRVGKPGIRFRRCLNGAVGGIGQANDASGRTIVTISLTIAPLEQLADTFEFQADCVVPDAITGSAMRSAVDHVIAGEGDGRADHDPIAVMITQIAVEGPIPVSPLVYREATSRALSTAFSHAIWDDFEPRITFEATVPHDNVGRFHAELMRRSLPVPAPADSFGSFQVFRGDAPLAPLLGFAAIFRTLTNGRGHWAVRPAGLHRIEPASTNITPE